MAKKYFRPANYDYEKYCGKRAYMDIASNLRNKNMQKAFSVDEKLLMLSDMVDYINENDIDFYRDFMDIICKEKEDWFNLLIFDRKARMVILEYTKSYAKDKKIAEKKVIFDKSCVSDEEPIERNCTTCEFYNTVCMGYGKRTDNGDYTYGMPIEEALEMFPNGCEDYGVSVWTFIELEKRDGR